MPPKTISTVPLADKPRLSPIEATVYLEQQHGIRISWQTLARLRTEGGGPLFCKPLKTIIYAKADLDEWAIAKTARPVRSTAQLSENAKAAAGS